MDPQDSAQIFAECVDFGKCLDSLSTPDQGVVNANAPHEGAKDEGICLPVFNWQQGPVQPSASGAQLTPNGAETEHKPAPWDGLTQDMAPVDPMADQQDFLANTGLGTPPSEGEPSDSGNAAANIAVLQQNPAATSVVAPTNTQLNRPGTTRPSTSTLSTTLSATLSTTLALAAAGTAKSSRPRNAKKEEETEEEQERRDRFLERNRLAASKCRNKKKEYVARLEAAEKVLAHENKRLVAKRASLTAEINDLKHLVMIHANCNDDHIDRWLQAAASLVAQSPSETLSQLSGSLPQDQPSDSLSQEHLSLPSSGSISHEHLSLTSSGSISHDHLSLSQEHLSLQSTGSISHEHLSLPQEHLSFSSAGSLPHEHLSLPSSAPLGRTPISAGYPSFQHVDYSGNGMGLGERQGSMAYSHGEPSNSFFSGYVPNSGMNVPNYGMPSY